MSLERLLKQFTFEEPIFTIQYDSLVEKAEQEGLGIKEASGGRFWMDAKLLAEYVAFLYKIQDKG